MNEKLHFRTLYICNGIIADGAVICFERLAFMVLDKN